MIYITVNSELRTGKKKVVQILLHHFLLSVLYPVRTIRDKGYRGG